MLSFESVILCYIMSDMPDGWFEYLTEDGKVHLRLCILGSATWKLIYLSYYLSAVLLQSNIWRNNLGAPSETKTCCEGSCCACCRLVESFDLRVVCVSLVYKFYTLSSRTCSGNTSCKTKPFWWWRWNGRSSWSNTGK